MQADTALHIAVRKSSLDVERMIGSSDRVAEALKVQNVVSALVC